MMKRLLFFMALIILLLTACTNANEADTDKEANPVQTEENSELTNDDTLSEEDTEDVIVEVEEVLPYVYPLTGLRTDQDISQRVIGVMVNNHKYARPQSGLHKADVVYEVLAEGNITRFLALYQSEMPEVFGPIRSARHYYIDLNNGYNGFYLHHGWSPLAKDMVRSGKVDNLNGIYFDGILYHRASFRNAPHNSYITFENVMEGADRKGYSFEDEVTPLPFLTEDEVASLSGEAAHDVTITYARSYDVRYDYDAEDKTYTRYSSGEKTVDLETETPITTNNIFIVEVPHYFIDNYPRRGLSLTEGGKGYLIGNGIVREVEWQNVDGRILPFHEGKEVGFIPGKTWINIIPTDPGIEESVKILSKQLTNEE
jgi:hypothetical protein